MDVRVITLRYQEGLQGFPEEALRRIVNGYVPSAAPRLRVNPSHWQHSRHSWLLSPNSRTLEFSLPVLAAYPVTASRPQLPQRPRTAGAPRPAWI